MKRTFLLLFILVSVSNGFAQKGKNMTLSLPSKTMPGRFFTKTITIFPYYFNDTMTDTKLISSFKYLPPIKLGPYYVLYEKDSLRYAVTISYNDHSKVYTVTHYQPDGAVISIAKYDENNELHGSYTEFYPGKGYYEIGKYKHGKEDGTWKTFDKNGKLTTMSVYKNGKEVNTQIYTIPQDDAFTKKHKVEEAPAYTIGPYIAPKKKR